MSSALMDGPGFDHGTASLGRVFLEMIRHEPGSYLYPPGRLGHDRPVVTLLAVVGGQLELTVGQRQMVVGTGRGVFVGGETGYSFSARKEVSYIRADFGADHPGLPDVLPERCVPLDPSALMAATSAVVAHIFRSMNATRAAMASAAGQRARVLSHIAARHADAELNVTTLAADLGLSTRTLQRLFAGQSMGVAEEITAARLRHALTLLRDPLFAGVSLDEIATRSGFGAVGRLRRALRMATGRSPSEYRAQYGDS